MFAFKPSNVLTVPVGMGARIWQSLQQCDFGHDPALVTALPGWRTDNKWPWFAFVGFKAYPEIQPTQQCADLRLRPGFATNRIVIADRTRVIDEL